MALPHSAMGWSAVCDSGISRSYFRDFIYGLQRVGGGGGGGGGKVAL